ncbi:hypothetical protein [Achromobacter pulmonis]|jgi:hypothetical protein|nr:hypothetical protein [Achromobacter pulmonis]
MAVILWSGKMGKAVFYAQRRAAGSFRPLFEAPARKRRRYLAA